MIGCVAFVQHHSTEGKRIVGIQCKKGRGTILPGGKWEVGETFVDCARRELREETGLEGYDFKLVFQGMSEEGFYTYAFSCKVYDISLLGTGDEKCVLTNWEDLKKSKFGGYYELMEKFCDN